MQRILYCSIDAVGNPAAGLFTGTPRDAANGPGFGRRDLTVVNVAGSLRVDPALNCAPASAMPARRCPRL